MEKIEKIDIAKELLESALFHLYDSMSYFSSIQCAGAAEEIFGKYVEMYDGESAYDNFNTAVRKISGILNGQESSKKDVAYEINYAKNSTKHMDGADDTAIYVNPKHEAIDLINRALVNYYYLMRYFELEETENIKRFNHEYAT